MLLRFLSFSFSILFIAVLVLSGTAHAAPNSLSIHPAGGTYTVGSTFDVSVFLDTGGQYVNALEIFLSYPPDKLQLVSPSAGSSIIDIWTTQPRYSNERGTVELRGGIPRGINVSQGLITTLKFRVKSTGSAVVRFTDETKLYLNDGQGTNVLYETNNGIYSLILPPPAGPIVISETHPDQLKWYSNSTAVLSWANEADVDGYSYILTTEPVVAPDDTSEGIRNSIAYKNLSDGAHYFHIKALRSGKWGGVTHYVLKIDTSAPAEFPLEISPSTKTTDRQPVVKFATTDAHSGMSHYELKVVPVTNVKQNDAFMNEESQPFFIEVESPFIMPELELGRYDVILRAYDQAGNFIDVTERLRITDSIFQFVGDRGLEIRNVIVIPWFLLWIILILLILLTALVGWRLKLWHEHADIREAGKRLPGEVREKLEQLKEYQKKYGKAIPAILLLFGIAAGLLAPNTFIKAQELGLDPPFVTTISRNISNEEIFYVGGKTDAANIEVIMYLQNIRTGETTSEIIISDKRGDWFYRHNAFLSSGDYLLWTQSRLAEETSPPSPQIQLTVRSTAIQFGTSRLSFEFLYLTISIILLILLLGTGAYTLVHAKRARRKKREFLKEIKEAEESVRRGFAVLRRDIQAELNIMKSAKLTKKLSEEERKTEEQLMDDLAWAEQYIGKELWDVYRIEEES